MAKYKVLSTKKLAAPLIEEAKERGIDITETEFISIQPVRPEEKYREIAAFFNKEYVVITSSNAARSVDKYLQWGVGGPAVSWKFFCLSGKTRETLLNTFAEEPDIMATAENAKALAGKIIEFGVKEIVFFCGNKRRDELPTILQQYGIKVHELVVYETVETPAVAPDNIDAILFFSPSAVSSFFSVNQLKEETVCFAIGETTANTISVFTHNKMVVSQSPSQEGMMAALYNYFLEKH